jgi:hypothetical protein
VTIAISQAGLPDIRPGMSNGATFDPETGNLEGTALASAARAAQTESADIVNVNCRGAVIFLNVTAASGTGGLQVVVRGKDPVSGAYVNLNNVPTAVIATGLLVYTFYPGATAVGAATFQGVLPRTFRIRVIHGDASSYTYSVGYSLTR